MEASTSREPLRGDVARERAAEPARMSPVTADPGPLGLAAFATTTFVLSMFNANLVSARGLPVVFGLALAYGGIAQVLAGMWEFRAGNTFGATAFTSFGAFWLSYWALVHFNLLTAATQPHALGIYLFAWAIFTSYMFVASLRTTAAIALVFALLAVTFILLGIGNANLSGTALTNSTIKAGGWVGLATAAAAWYASFASVTNSTFGRIMLPVIDLKERIASH